MTARALVLSLALAGVLVPAVARGRTWRAAPGGAPPALAAAVAGDTVVLARGAHAGPLLVRAAIVVRGEPGAVVDGGRRGTVITVAASGATVEDLEVRGSGTSVMHEDAAVAVLTSADVRLSRLAIGDALYGVYGERAGHVRIEECTLSGRVRATDGSGEGNGIHLWYCDAPRIERNHVTHFVDAIYLSFTNHATLADNLVHHCGRYGFHTMYCQEGTLERNRFTHNVAGCAIMFSNHLRVTGNAFVRNQGARTYGLLLRDCSDGTFTDNRIVANTVGVFLDGSNRNRFLRNLVQDNGWGVLLFSSCAGDTFAGNDFIANDYPVALDMRRTDNAFDDGRGGNYWSEAAAYDLDGDGAGDAPHSPVTAFAFLSKQYPDLTLFSKSPAVAALDAAEQVFPALRPSEAVDRFPRVRPVALPPDRSPRLPGDAAPARRRGVAQAAGFALMGLAGAAGFVLGGGRRS